MGADAIDRVGISNSTVEEAEVKRLALAAARTTVLLADSSKFDRRSFARVCRLEEISMLVTDEASQESVGDLDDDSLRIEFV